MIQCGPPWRCRKLEQGVSVGTIKLCVSISRDDRIMELGVSASLSARYPNVRVSLQRRDLYAAEYMRPTCPFSQFFIFCFRFYG